MKRNFLLTAALLSMGRLKFLSVVVAFNAAIALLFACQSTTPAIEVTTNKPQLNSQQSPTAKKLPPAPLSKPPLGVKAVPQVYIKQWQQTGKRGAVCAAIAPTSLGKGQGAKPRPASFGSDAWAVAYDKPGLPGRKPDGSFCANCGRSAFGIAGTASNVDSPQYQGFPFHRQWADGSHADYGLEGGDRLPYLAYLTIKGQRCSYNVWSFLGREHLEYLLDRLRFVKGAP